MAYYALILQLLETLVVSQQLQVPLVPTLSPRTVRAAQRLMSRSNNLS
jgi:hypothetical protein